jgi:hypothetical protein
MDCGYATNCPPPPAPPSGGIGTAVSIGPFGTLPMTGAELALYLCIGLAIIAAGIALRLYTRENS